MKIRITMVSGTKFDFENTKYKNIQEWLSGNFKEEGKWFKISEECNFVLNIDLIETIEEVMQ